MAIPNFETIMGPLLAHLQDGRPRNTTETLDALAAHFGLTPAEREQLLPSGTQPLFTNRVAWAKFHLKKALCVSNPRRGLYEITERGRKLLGATGGRVSVETLNQFPEFREFLLKSRTTQGQSGDLGSEVIAQRPVGDETHGAELTPEEHIDLGYSQLTAQLESELLAKVKEASPEFFDSWDIILICS